MAKRKPITKKLRFEVFKRDSFTCQYCGRMAPDVILEVDHINPVANGGENEIMNLITACFDCNRGKGKKKLSDNAEIKKQQEQLTEINQKREQLRMMLEWKKELTNLDNEQVQEFENNFQMLTNNNLTDHGRGTVKKWIKQFGLIEILDCLEISVSQYFNEDDNDTIKKTFNFIPRIATNRKKNSDNPMYGKQCYIRAILRNRVSYINENQLSIMLREIKTETDFEEFKMMATSCRNWTDFKESFIIFSGRDDI